MIKAFEDSAAPLAWVQLKARAYFETRWRQCSHGECRARRTCTGGPRGTFKKQGRPVCFAADDEPVEHG